MDYFDFNMQLPDRWSDSDSEKTLVVHSTPVRTTYLRCPRAHLEDQRERYQVGTPLDDPGKNKSDVPVSVSYTFHPCFTIDGLSPDLVLASTDQVLFYVHHHRILCASENGFGMLLVAPLPFTPDAALPTVSVPEPADVLNIILHIVYNISAMAFGPTFETISAALDALPRYGIDPKAHASVGQPLYDLILACAPLQPIETYALAGAHDLGAAAASASAHLLSFPLPTLSDALAARMGAVYLKKLFFLHFGRMDALKRVLIKPPATHPETAECSLSQQKCLMRAWAAAHVMWDAGPSECSMLS